MGHSSSSDAAKGIICPRWRTLSKSPQLLKRTKGREDIVFMIALDRSRYRIEVRFDRAEDGSRKDVSGRTVSAGVLAPVTCWRPSRSSSPTSVIQSAQPHSLSPGPQAAISNAPVNNHLPARPFWHSSEPILWIQQASPLNSFQ